MHSFSIQYALHCLVYLSSITTICGAAWVVKPSSSLAQFITFIGIVITVFVVFEKIQSAKNDLLKWKNGTKVYIECMKACRYTVLISFIFAWNSFLIRVFVFFTLNFTFFSIFFSYSSLYSWKPVPSRWRDVNTIATTIHIILYAFTVLCSVILVYVHEMDQRVFYLFYAVLVLLTSWHKIEYWEMVGKRLEENAQRNPPIANTRHQNPECDICYHAYNNSNRAPRILKECGHTLCQGCILKLTTRVSLTCPFCKSISPITRKWYTDFPVNYAILKMIRK